MEFVFKWHVLWRYKLFMLEGIGITITMAIAGMALAMTLGMIIALMRLSGNKLFQIIADLYTQIFRATPLFVYLIWVYYGISMLSGVNIPAITTGLICISMIHSAFLAETYRAGIESIPKGHREAGLSVGLSESQVMRDIVLPQAIRTVLPPIANEFTVVFKSTTILGIIGVEELVRRAQHATTVTYRPFEFYTAVAVLFIIMVIALSRVNLYIERKFKYQ